MARTKNMRLAAILAIAALILSGCGEYGLEDFLSIVSSSSEADSSSLEASSSSSDASASPGNLSSSSGSPNGSQNCASEKVPASVLPEDIRAKFEDLMPIYSGNMPPDISGQYRATNITLIGSSINGDAGNNWSDIYLAFIKEANGKLSYQEAQGNSYTAGSDGTKVDIAVVGCDDDFTAYFITNGMNEGISTKTSTIISGTLKSTGIRDFYYAFIMLSKGPDPSNKIVPVNTYRVFTDADGLAEKRNWLTN